MMNYSFLAAISPTRVAIKGIIFSAFFFLITPAYVTIDLSLWPFIYIISAFLFFFAGCYAVPVKIIKLNTKFKLPLKQQNIIFYIILAISMLGIAMRLYERIFIRGITFGGDIFDNRENLESSGSTLVGVLSTLMYPLVYFNLFWYLYCKRKNKWEFALVLGIFFFPSVDSYMIGSRSMILQNLVVLGMLIKTFTDIKFTAKTWFYAILSSIIVIFLFLLILYNRLGGETFEFDFTAVATLSDYNFTYAVKPSFLTSIENDPANFSKLIKFAFVNVGQYINHGIFEFNYLLTHYNPDNLHDWGRNNLFLYYRFIDIFQQSNVIRPGLAVREAVYTTFFGEVYIDFGWWGMIFMFLLGALIKSIYIKILKGNVFFIPMYFVFLYIIFFMLTSNLLSGGMGIIVINALFIPVILYYLIKKKKFKQQISNDANS